jgi:hypothetical protein
MAQHKIAMENASIVILATLLFTGINYHETCFVQSFAPSLIVSQPVFLPIVLRSTSTDPSIETSSWRNDDEYEAQFQIIEADKMRLIALCESKNPLLEEIREAVSDLENINDENANIYTWMNGEWELLYTPVDITRSSPFFWAFRQAFPDVSDQIYSITDGIPSPIKQVGPAYQQVDGRYILDGDNSSGSGTFVSRVKVATLGGIATSMMTTRASIIGCDNNIDQTGCELRIKIETTKPEQSTVIQKLFGEQFGTMINDSLPPYPSGETLEQIVPGSSEVIVMTTFCDPTLRITKNKNRPADEFFIWKRKSFNTYETM